jgi:hypothetical protein
MGTGGASFEQREQEAGLFLAGNDPMAGRRTADPFYEYTKDDIDLQPAQVMEIHGAEMASINPPNNYFTSLVCVNGTVRIATVMGTLGPEIT